MMNPSQLFTCIKYSTHYYKIDYCLNHENHLIRQFRIYLQHREKNQAVLFFFFNKTISFIKRKSLVHIFKFKMLLPFSFEAGILPTSLRCSAHVVLNSSDLTSSYPITSSTQRITTTEFKDVSHEDLILSIQNMKNSLAVNKSETSSEIRKKISVYESRTSAVSMGLIGTIVIVLVILCPVISDLTSVIQRRKK